MTLHSILVNVLVAVAGMYPLGLEAEEYATLTFDAFALPGTTAISCDEYIAFMALSGHSNADDKLTTVNHLPCARRLVAYFAVPMARPTISFLLLSLHQLPHRLLACLPPHYRQWQPKEDFPVCLLPTVLETRLIVD